MKRCVPHRTDTLLGSYLFESTCLFVETLPRLFILSFSPFFKITKKIFSSLHCISFIFVRLFCKLSSPRSSDPYHFGGTRSVLSWETIVHYPRYKFRGQIRLKDTTLFRGLRSTFSFVCFCTAASGLFFLFLVCEQYDNTLKTNLCCVRLQIFSFMNFCCVRLQIFFLFRFYTASIRYSFLFLFTF